MKEILYRNRTSTKNKRKIISLSERVQKGNALVHTHRMFIYVIVKEVESVGKLPAPVFSIIKNTNTKTKDERFLFRVKGVFYIIKEKGFLLVSFSHSLRIDILHPAVV